MCCVTIHLSDVPWLPVQLKITSIFIFWHKSDEPNKMIPVCLYHRCWQCLWEQKLSDGVPPIYGDHPPQSNQLFTRQIPFHIVIVRLIIFIMIRLNRSTTYVDVAYCYRLISVVCRSVCLSITVVSPSKNGRTDRDATWVVGLDGPKKSCIRWSPDPPMARGNFEGERAAHCKT